MSSEDILHLLMGQSWVLNTLFSNAEISQINQLGRSKSDFLYFSLSSRLDYLIFCVCVLFAAVIFLLSEVVVVARAVLNRRAATR